MSEARRIVDAFFAAVQAGELPDALLTEDMTGWITTGGTMSKAAYQGLVRMMPEMISGSIDFMIDAITAQNDRIVAEVRSAARLVNGDTYEQTYVYVFTVREGKIASVAEHYNALVAQEKLAPLMKQIRGRSA